MRLGQKLLWPLEKDGLGGLVAEAIGLAVERRVHGAVGLDVLAKREPHDTLVVELAFRAAAASVAPPSSNAATARQVLDSIIVVPFAQMLSKGPELSHATPCQAKGDHWREVARSPT